MTTKINRLRVLNDFAFKKVFGEKGDETQLIALLNAILKRTDKDAIVSIEIIENKELPADFIGGKASKLDVRAVLANGTKVNIEVQLKNEYNMDKRSLRYWALEYTRGIAEGQDYIELPPVIVINILDFDYIPLDDYHTSFHLYEDRHKECMLTDALEMHYIEIGKWRKLKDKDYGEAIHRWMVYFDERSPPELIEEVMKMDMAIEAANAKLEKIKSDPELVHAYDLYEQDRIDYKFGMQGARLEGRLEGLREGEKKGLREGEKKGLREGEKKGRLEGRLEIARNLKCNGIPIQEITLWTGLSPDEIAKL